MVNLNEIQINHNSTLFYDENFLTSIYTIGHENVLIAFDDIPKLIQALQQVQKMKEGEE